MGGRGQVKMAIGVAALAGLAGGPVFAASTSARGAVDPGATVSPLAEGVLGAIELVSERSADPARTRGTLLWRLRHGAHCYAGNLTAEQYAELLEKTHLWPLTHQPPMDGIQPRFFTDTRVWAGAGQIGDAGLSVRADLTYSFPEDGVPWGLTAAGFTGTNVLGAKLTTAFGSLDRGREYIRASLAAWRRVAGLTYTEVADDNTAMTMLEGRVATRGDVRIGGWDFAASPNGILAYNAFPTNQSASTIGGADMAINTSYFIASNFNLPTGDFLYFRNTIAHEHGHGLGYIHTIPCTGTKLMEPTISLGPTTLTRDEIRGAGRNYGDRYSGNQTRVAAHFIGNLTSPMVRSAILRDLSTNVGINTTAEEDFFRFTLGTPQDVTITVQPTGETSMQGQQTGTGCTGTPASIDSLACGNLNLELQTTAGAVIAAAPAQPAGTAETLTVNGLAAGDYIVYVRNATSSTTAALNQFVQTYDLTVRVGSSVSPPDAIAGIHKRIRAGTTAHFNGSANSRATEAGASLASSGYEWDLDGDGVFETSGQAQPTFVYPSNGTIPVTLRLTDSNGMSATDQINVTVFGATTTVSSVSPVSGSPGASVPVTIFGANFKGVTSASQVTVGGTGVTVTGTPVVNNLGTQITGLSFVISAGAMQSARNVTITNSDGQGSGGTGTAVFTVGEPGQPPANDECTGAVVWTGTGNLPFNNNNATTGAQQSFPSTGCPVAGPIANDVWYVWTAPTRGTITVNTDSAAMGFQTRVAMYRNTTCPPVAGGSGVLRCDDFGTAFTASVTTGSSYLFQVGSVTAGATGSANVTLSLAASQGACCNNGICTTTGEGPCLSGGGEWTFQATCTPTFCPESTGACCVTASCFINTPAECATLGSSAEWQGAGTVCGTSGNPVTCCAANINQIDGLTVQDLFDFLIAWFAQAPAGDFNDDGGVTLQDLFDYLVAYFSGCA